MTVVIDASAALKWVLDEEGSDRATALIEGDTLIAPDLWLIECANVLAMKARRGLLTNEEAVKGLAVIEAVGGPACSKPGICEDGSRAGA